MEEQENDFRQDMERLLDEHDYALPEVGDIRTGIIVSVSERGVIVDLGLKRDGIIQPQDLEKLPQEERDSLQADEEISVYILSTAAQDSLIISRHMALLNQDWIRAQELLDEDEIFEGEIVGHNRGGALVAFGGLRGFIPASHLSMLRSNLNDQQRQQFFVKLEGETVPLKVIEVDRRRRRLVLSNRNAEKVWREARRKEFMETIKTGDVITGRVSGWRDFGAFVDLGGVDGLVHVSELAWYRVNHPREVVRVGEEVEVYVLRVDRERQRISLSRKKLLPNPWSLVEDKYLVGQLVEGKIIRIVDYGAFVELEPGVEGLLHVSQVSRSNIQNPREVVGEGETHLLRVISVDTSRERIGLSLKAVRAHEQIDWMTQREAEAARQATAEREAAEQAAVKPASEDETSEQAAKAEGVEQTIEAEGTEQAAVKQAPEDETSEQAVVEQAAKAEGVEQTIEAEGTEQAAVKPASEDETSEQAAEAEGAEQTDIKPASEDETSEQAAEGADDSPGSENSDADGQAAASAIGEPPAGAEENALVEQESQPASEESTPEDGEASPEQPEELAPAANAEAPVTSK